MSLNVRELIALLSAYPSEHPVYVDTHEGWLNAGGVRQFNNTWAAGEVGVVIMRAADDETGAE